MAYNEAETRYELIDPVLREKGYREWRVKLETPAPVEPTGHKGRRRTGNGRTDYLLCVQTGNMPKPLPVGVIEAKAESEDPLKGMEQGKRYAECLRFAVQYVFATNGHRYGEFDLGTKVPDGPFTFPLLSPPLEQQVAIAAELKEQLTAVEEARQSAEAQLREIERLPQRLLAQVFDFEEEAENA